MDQFFPNQQQARERGGDGGACANSHVWKPLPNRPVAPARGVTTPIGAGTASSGTELGPLLASCTFARLRRLSPIAAPARRMQSVVRLGAPSQGCCDSGGGGRRRPPLLATREVAFCPKPGLDRRPPVASPVTGGLVPAPSRRSCSPGPRQAAPALSARRRTRGSSERRQGVRSKRGS